MLRIVVRAGMSHEMADLLLRDLRSRTALLEALSAHCRRTRPQVSAFSHSRRPGRRRGNPEPGDRDYGSRPTPGA